MGTLEEFENAPVGATATHPDGIRVVMREGDETDGFPWVCTTYGELFCNEELAEWGYTLERPEPTTAREALDLAWNLAHEVKEGQTIPEGVRLLDRSYRNDLIAYAPLADFTVNARESLSIRTLDPLPEPEPDWLDAPAVLARLEDKTWTAVWQPCDDLWCPGAESSESRWATPHGGSGCRPWRELRDVTPLYPKETNA